MPKRKPAKKRSRASSSDEETGVLPTEMPSEAMQTEAIAAFTWTPLARFAASVLIVVYLGIVVLGPLSNPIASPYFSQPLAARVAPIHQAMFQGHGYRFFGPDPGPSHRVLYRGTRSDGSVFEGVFPDRNEHQPRLMYHRWFMLSETLFYEISSVPSETQLEQYKQEYDDQIQRLTAAGQSSLVRKLQQERAMELAAIQVATERAHGLAASIATILCQRNDGSTLQLFVQERSLPFPEEVQEGVSIDDPSFLAEPIRIGTFDGNQFQPSSLEVIKPDSEGQTGGTE